MESNSGGRPDLGLSIYGPQDYRTESAVARLIEMEPGLTTILSDDVHGNPASGDIQGMDPAVYWELVEEYGTPEG